MIRALYYNYKVSCFGGDVRPTREGDVPFDNDSPERTHNIDRGAIASKSATRLRAAGGDAARAGANA